MPRSAQLACCILSLLTLPAAAQVTRVGVVRPKPRFTWGDTITVSASPSTVSFALVSGGVAPGSSPVVITTSWTGISILSTLNIYAYFANSTSALSGSSPVINIPSSNVLGKDSAGIPTTFTSFTQTSPFGGAGASLQLYSLTTFFSFGGSHTDNLSLEIDLTSLPQLPAATYTGVLYVQAQAF